MKKILVLTDFSDNALNAFRYAIWGTFGIWGTSNVRPETYANKLNIFDFTNF